MSDDVWILTDAAGFIQECNAAALAMLGYSARGVRGRELPNLFTSDRPRLSELLLAAHGTPTERQATIRPNDRKELRVTFRVERGAGTPEGPVELRWTFDVRFPIGLRLPRGIDRRQLITVWRTDALHCVFVPAGQQKRRLFVCAADGAVLHEETPADAAAAFERAAELHRLAGRGLLRG